MTQTIRCCSSKCKKMIKLSKSDLKMKKSIDSLGIGSFAKLCKKHELEMAKRCEVKT